MKVLQGKVGKDPVYGILALINTQEPNQPMVFKQKKMSVEQIICNRYTASFYHLLKTIKVLQEGMKDGRSHYKSQIKSKLWHWNHY
ncbi:hypothetical protein JHK82_055774 [Glycine max]|uniref:Uncharacterized protein n=1 Tax=Glycine max TaxID=3847 RepID=A0A0R0E8H3_SOYBN|nr:hypothetical protein JHK85_056598 [Glycine max]KAG5074403.1 hypothetical protein JHK84_055634 [Glycine max]KAG5077079.1 hypothetical protein JHK82_055774 [Glycine max]KAH1035103.1 hypothetical protein GYH30_055187 [Glycine max]